MLSMFDSFAENILRAAESLSLDALALIDFGSYLFIYILVLVLTLANKKVKRLSKRPLYCLANAYTALTFVLFLSRLDFKNAAVLSVSFWIIAYLLYGLAFALSLPRKKEEARGVKAVPPRAAYPSAGANVPEYARNTPETTAAKSTVRLEHAQAITDKLLQKQLTKSDRQELEKLKDALSVLQVKGTLSAEEGEMLNAEFNVLLKLMAKYEI